MTIVYRRGVWCECEVPGCTATADVALPAMGQWSLAWIEVRTSLIARAVSRGGVRSPQDPRANGGR